MTAFNTISPQSAAALITQAGMGDPMAVLANHGMSGSIKGYADWMEKVQPNGSREEVRLKRIPREMWRRIIYEGKTADVATGTVHLDGSSDFGGGPKCAIVGILFDDMSLQATIARHSAKPRGYPARPKAPPPARISTASLSAVCGTPPVDHIPPERRRPDPSAIPPGAITVTVKQAMAATGLGRTTIDGLMKRGVLERVKVGSRTLITVASIEKLIRGGEE